MKQTTKRLLSVLVCVAMALAMLPVAVFAAGTTVYCQAPESWTQCNVYWWGSSESVGWPGAPMTQDANGIWEYDVPSDATNVIFNDGNGTQTDDLVMPTDDQNMYVFENRYWTGYGPVTIVVEYYVAGSAALCGSDWNPGDAANKMTEGANGIYTKTFLGVSAGSYQLKVTNGSWAESWGGSGENGNVDLVVDSDNATVEVSFDSNTQEVKVRINGTLINAENIIAQEDAVFTTVDEAFSGVAASFIPSADGTVTVDITACDPGFYLDMWCNGEYVQEALSSTPNTYSFPVTGGDSYEFTICPVEMYSESLYDFKPGTISYKITSSVPAQEGQGGEISGEGTSESNPMVIPGSFMNYIEAGQTIWFLVDISQRAMQEGVYTQMLGISAGTDYSVSYREMDIPVDEEGFVSYEMVDMPRQGKYLFSVTNNGVAKAFFTIEVSDRPAYINNGETLVLGDNDVTPDSAYTYTLYEFTPEETGVYSFTVSEGVVGDWGTAAYPTDSTENKTNKVEWTCTGVGQSILIGVGETESAVVTVARTGDYTPPTIVDWTFYENTYDFSKEIPADAELVEIDVTDDKADVAVVDADGFYRYGSAYGPLMVVNLSECPINLEDAQINGQLRAYVYDKDGNVIARNDYNEAMMEYMVAGTVPVTEELGKMIQELGNDKGWWEPGGFVFVDKTPSDPATAWMTFCSYMKDSELTPPAGGSNNGGSNNGGSNNGGSNNGGNGGSVSNNKNPQTGDCHLIGAALAMVMAGTALVVLKKKED